MKKTLLPILAFVAIAAAQVPQYKFGPMWDSKALEHGIGPDSNANLDTLRVKNLYCTGNCNFSDTLYGISDTVKAVMATGGADSLWIKGGGARIDSNLFVNGTILGRCGPYSGPYASTNLCWGKNAGMSITTGPINTFIGDSSGLRATTANDVFCAGLNSCRDITNAIDLVLVGNYAGERGTNIEALTGVGWRVFRFGRYTARSTGFGARAGENLDVGDANVLNGFEVARYMDSANFNVSSGFMSSYRLKNSNYNTAVGAYAGTFILDGSTYATKANGSTFLGAYSRPKENSTTNEIVVGAYASGYGPYTATIGNPEVTIFVPGRDGMDFGDSGRAWGRSHMKEIYFSKSSGGYSGYIGRNPGYGLQIAGSSEGLIITAATGGILAYNLAGTNDLSLNPETGTTSIGRFGNTTNILGGLSVAQQISSPSASITAIEASTVTSLSTKTKVYAPVQTISNNSQTLSLAVSSVVTDTNPFTASRVVTLPAFSSITPYGEYQTCVDFSDAGGAIVGGWKLIIRPSGTDKVNGSSSDIVIEDRFGGISICFNNNGRAYIRSTY